MSQYVNAEQNFLALDGDAFRAPLGTTITDAAALAALATPWLPYGAVEAGFVIPTAQDRTPRFVWNKRGAAYRIITNNEIKTIVFKAPDRSQATVLTQNRGGLITPVAGTAKTVSNKALTANVATLTTTVAHGFTVGQTVTVAGVDAVFNGSYVITAVPTTTTFSYAKTNADIVSAAATGTATVATGIFKWADNPNGSDEFALALDVRDGTKHLRYFFPASRWKACPRRRTTGRISARSSR